MGSRHEPTALHRPALELAIALRNNAGDTLETALIPGRLPENGGRVNPRGWHCILRVAFGPGVHNACHLDCRP
jgi:hypothetical protein